MMGYLIDTSAELEKLAAAGTELTRPYKCVENVEKPFLS